MISVLIADDQRLVRAGFRRILESDPGITVVGEAEDGAQAVAAARQHSPDVVVMDIRMPEMNGLEATRRLVNDTTNKARVLVLTTFDLDNYVYEALQAGASGFLLKDAPPDELIAAVKVVAHGDALLAPSITRKVIAEFARRLPPDTLPAASLDVLTGREREVLGLLAQGLSNAEIASRLVVSDATAKTHVARILAKLDLRDRVHAVILAYESGLVRPGRG
jgi:DNA-binding NarL/FixJ family response regulator